MSLALTTQTAHHRLRTKQLYINAQASGNYVPGGDPVNFNNLVGEGVAPNDSTIGYPGKIKDYSVISAPPGYSASLVKGSTLSNWGLQVFQNAADAPVGVPLSLGTLSAAATQSTYTATGLVTVATTTPPPLGSFIVLSNGASSYGIQFDGVMVQVTAVVAGTSYSFQFGQGSANHYTVNTDTLKYQVVQASASNLLTSVTSSSPITGVLATANLLTITQANSYQVGQFVYLGGTFKTASVYASGAIVQVVSATATGWTANWQGTIIAQTSGEVATSALLVTNGGAPITAYPYQSGPLGIITNVTGVASATTAAGLLTLSSAQLFQAGMLAVIQGVGTATALDGTIGTVIATNLGQTSFKMNAWNAVAQSSTADTGYAAVIVTGAPANPTGELPADPYPAAALAAPFVIMVEGPKGQI